MISCRTYVFDFVYPNQPYQNLYRLLGRSEKFEKSFRKVFFSYSLVAITHPEISILLPVKYSKQK